MESRELSLTHSDARADGGSPTLFPTNSLETAAPRPARVATHESVSRAEVVRIVERTADAAVRMRAAGTERIEVAVQLGNGDQLTIQLQFTNGEVTPHFRTSSEGLRTALEQHWTQFSERASDRGVRLTPPVFDVNSSSSNMADLSQQRHGRDAAYADAQAELFSHLPRRTRPARVLAAAPFESSPAAPAGVRAYA